MLNFYNALICSHENIFICAPIHSTPGAKQNFERMFFTGELEVELVPQGTIAARLRAAGNGMPAIFTPAGVGEWSNGVYNHTL